MEQTPKQKKLSKDWYAKTKRWSADEWIGVINTIKDPLQRNRVAAVVWWDHSQRRDDLLPILDMCRDFIEERDGEPLTSEQLAEGLRKVGYPEHLIADRSRTRSKKTH